MNWLTIFYLVVAGLAYLGYRHMKNRAVIRMETRKAKRSMVVHEMAKNSVKARRPVRQVIHTHAPDSVVFRMFRWKPEKRIRNKVRIARRGFRGRYVRIRPDQHIMIVGMTGSGKSSTLRVLGAWALLAPGWYLEAFDGKWGASVVAYEGKARVHITIDAIEARLRDLVERELPLRARRLREDGRVSHLAIIMDESRLLNELTSEALRNLVTLIQTGRELGVHCWFGLQDPKADSIPTAIRDQFTCKIVHMLQNQDAAQVALKELVAGGWHPHKLMRSGQVLVWEPVRKPRVLFGLWLTVGRLASLQGLTGPLSAPELDVPVSLVKASVRPVGNAPDLGNRTRTDGRTDALTERQAAAVMVLAEGGAMGPAALAAELGLERNRAHDVLKQLVAKGFATTTEEGIYTLVKEN
jgi:hypothetical protein